MGELEIRGLDSRTTARLLEQWKLRVGDVFDETYPGTFLELSYKDPSLEGWTASAHRTMDEVDKTVDVTLQFEAPKK
jgi:hypothetical protein